MLRKIRIHSPGEDTPKEDLPVPARVSGFKKIQSPHPNSYQDNYGISCKLFFPSYRFKIEMQWLGNLYLQGKKKPTHNARPFFKHFTCYITVKKCNQPPKIMRYIGIQWYPSVNHFYIMRK